MRFFDSTTSLRIDHHTARSLIGSVLLIASWGGVIGCDDESSAQREAAGEVIAGTEAGQTAGQTSGQTAGVNAGEVSAGETAGETAGVVSAGETSGEIAGEMSAGETAGVVSAGEVGGETAGETAPQDVIAAGLSPEVAERFDEAPRASECSPLSLIYPEPFTTIPQNLRGLTFQWVDASARGPYLLEARSGASRFRWFTAEVAITPEGITWESAKISAPNGVSEWSLSYLTAGGERCDGPTLNLVVDRSLLVGAVYYWSTRDAGIMRLAADEQAPEPLLTPAVAPEINCPACHALSRDGSRIAFTRTTFPPFGDLATSLTLDPRNLNYDPTGVEGYFPSFSPDPNILIAGSSGRLVIRDSNNGLELGELPLPMGTVGGSPDWSWSGERITAVVGPSGIFNPLPNVGINSGSIYEWVRQDETWPEPRELISPMGDTWNTNPAYSPDDTYIAYNVTGESPNAGDDGMGNPNVDLWIKRVGDDSPPVRLDKANRGSLQGNSWPKWSPYDRRGKLWLAFSSTRDYGHQLVQDPSSPTPQIWVTAIDLDAPPGQDPSSPAFWLPYQSLNSGNHIPYWAPYEKQ